MRIHTRTALALLALTVIAPVFAADSDREAFEEYYRDRLHVKAEPRQSPAVAQVFNGGIYLITLKFNVPGLGTQSLLSARKEGEVIRVESENSRGEMQGLLSLVRDDFVIAGRADAETFEKALNELYLGRWDDEENLHLVNTANQWIFVRDESFGDYKGFIVTTGNGGAIETIEASSELPVGTADLE